MVERLLQANANINYQNNVIQSHVFFIERCIFKYYSIYNYIYEVGNCINLLFAIKMGETALYVASLCGHVEIVKLLIQRKAEVNICKQV